MESKYVNIHQKLIDDCVTGNRKAQFEIYKKYYKAMFNTSLRIVNDTAEAEDILQESFLDAFRRIGSYTGEGSFGSWLKRIVVNRSLDCLRKSKDFVSLDEIGVDIPDDSDQISEEQLQYRVAEVKKAISQMPEDFRVILSLVLFEGYDHDEISGILNISNQLSRTRYSRARQKLLSLLKEKSFINAFSEN
ncbi:MAG: sigma-70 family RNA polymerase sigma factor [Bacteroidota bacterium]